MFLFCLAPKERYNRADSLVRTTAFCLSVLYTFNLPQFIIHILNCLIMKHALRTFKDNKNGRLFLKKKSKR